MKYEIETTNIFDTWFTGLKDSKSKARIISRFDKVQLGNLGDHKNLGGNLFELRFFFGPGYRIYYTIKSGRIVILLCGGDKSKQKKDIKLARDIMAELE
ncbi:MAG: addiction module killer protein [Candidatus Magnetoglobus multicellularis str. Araruama]|uniref:Addiction module killer protein n=1 Tax=Candidatus Magnetoglobus multicellularis str. Araruama TaxID=890399 RepID=A0A1V1P5X2_9BACT|nr:MAG: addiction module killer protein [Candidatus Magnetoglobus multicellularis str. Araruama]